MPQKEVNNSRKNQKNRFQAVFIMSERRDSNPESPAPKAGMLAVTPRSETHSDTGTV